MAKSKPLPPLEELQKVLSYDSETGLFIWIVKPSRSTAAGSVAGSIDSTGYRRIPYERRNWLAHRFAWLFATGEDPGVYTIDHVNRNRADNRFENLRLATPGQQNGNHPIRSDNASGFRGVSWNKSKKKWRAHLQVKDCRKFLGYFAVKEEAVAAYQKAAADHFGEFLGS